MFEAALTVNVPWHPEQGPVLERSKIAEIAERIDCRAQHGLTVHLRPATARIVAMTMRLYADGHPEYAHLHG